jgi:hypothetical protein
MTKCSVLIILMISLFQGKIQAALPQNAMRELSEKQWKLIEENEYIINSQMKNIIHNQQKLNYHATALHPKNCKIALRKISQYEQYKNFISFITRSEYNDQTKLLNFLLDHSLLPFKISLKFKIDRIERPGIYHFQFDHGFLRNLKGKINVSTWKNRCLMQMHATWQGPDTGINSTVFEVFSATLGKLGTAKIFRLSRY